MTKSCVFCLGPITSFHVGGNEYLQCANCGGIFLARDLLPSAEAERQRYELHRNSPDDSGFRTYLESFIEPVLDAIGGISTIFDYGSGPDPALVSILRSRGYDVRGWDPFFAPDTLPFDGGADLVVCHEVAEHFFEPRRDFALMAPLVKVGGHLVVGTMVLPENGQGGEGGPFTAPQTVREFFSSWWYRQDSTHVSFYSETALRITGESAGLTWLGAVGKNAYLFRRNSP
jgi:pseudouridine kinase